MKKLLFVPDLHWPYEDRRYWRLLMEVLEAWQPEILVLLGDAIDAPELSFHERTKNTPSKFRDSIAYARERLDEIDEILPDARKIYLEGNHEKRFERYVETRAAALSGLDHLSIPEQLRLQERGWEWSPYRSYVKVGKLYLSHDLEFAGKNAVRQNLDSAQRNIITGHTHRFGMVVEGDITGESHASAMFGWGGDTKKVDYKHVLKAKRDWPLGFGIARMDDKGFVYITPVPVIKYRCVVEGVLYSSR